MRKLAKVPAHALAVHAPTGVLVGALVGVNEAGRPRVDFPGNTGGPVEARSIVTVPPPDFPAAGAPASVLLVFENGDWRRPIIVGFVRDTLFGPEPARAATIAADRPTTARIDGKQVVLEAQEEVVLRCGQSSVTLRRDGKIVLLGSNIVSRASEVNKIKGGNVAIN